MINRPLNVAIVDDDDSVRRALRRLLETSDIHTQGFASGAELLRARNWALLDCIVIDLHMPRMTGLELMEQLSHYDWGIPTVMISAQDEPDSAIACLAAGASAILVKPVDEAVLLAAISDAVANRKPH
jgi:FixJ family two-component response regulator